MTEEVGEVKVYSREEAENACKTYFGDNEFGINVFLDKYALKDKNGNLLEDTPDKLHHRMAKEFARIEKNYPNSLSEDEIFHLFDQFKYLIPGGSVMASLGDTSQISSLSNCTVLPIIPDSYGGICYADQQICQISKRRAGVGLDISSLRNFQSPCLNSAKTSTGGVSFMHRFSNSAREVSQASRRGALMISCDISYYNVEEFIKIKQDLNKVTGANISVQITDEFMRAVKEDRDFTLQFPIEVDNPQVSKKVRARDLWNLLVECSTKTGEPGIMWKTRNHLYSTSSVYPQYKNITANPCSEIVMNSDTCRLMSMNVLGFVENPWTNKSKFNFELWSNYVYKSQRLIDSLVDLEIEAMDRILNKINSDPEPDYIKAVERETWQTFKKNALASRRTGLGLTALGDTLAALGLKYDSEEALTVTEKIMRAKCEAEFNASIDMAEERGSFLGFDPEIEKTSHFCQMLQVEFPELYARMMKSGRRNSSLSTIPPAGTLSTLINSTSGCEPCYTLSYKRRRKMNEGQEYDEIDAQGDKWKIFDLYHKGVKEWMRLNNSTKPEESPYYKSDANSVDWRKRIELLSICQKYTTHSISHTLNLPRGTTKETVSDIFMTAWEKGLKGCCVFVEGARDPVLFTGERNKKTNTKRPKSLPCDLVLTTISGEKWLLIVGLDENKRPFEVFGGASEKILLPKKFKEGIVIKNGKVDGRTTYDLHIGEGEDELVIKDVVNTFENRTFAGLTRMVSLSLRNNVPVKEICEQLQKDKYSDFQGMSKVMSRVLKKYILDGEKPSDTMCPECGQETLAYQGGCKNCVNPECGWSKCS